MKPIAFALLAVLIAVPAAAAPPQAPGLGCPHCTLAGTDLSNQCLQNSNFQGTDLTDAKLVMSCLSHANLRQASLRHADLSGANLFEAKLDAADFTGAVLSSTSLKSADLSRTKGLTQAQLDLACGDANTRLPAGLSVKRCQ